ncbi:IS1380 family transposase, partial [Candidatus Fermentibacteria bacterium]
GSIDELEFIVGKLRARWPKVRIILRGDCGFCRSYLLDWCEDNGVDYILGLAKNNRLKKIIGRQLYAARRRHGKTGKAARVFTWFWYKTEKSWRHERRVIAKAEHLDKGANPRFIVTSLPDSDRKLYEKVYCARGEMENRIKEQQLDLFADRTSTHWVSSNQLRLWFSTFAYILLNALEYSV